MAIPPFNNTRLNPHENLTKKKQEELFDAITRNLEDLYEKFPLTLENMGSTPFIRAVSGTHMANFGTGSATFAGGATATAEVSHELGVVPRVVLITASDSLYNAACFAKSKTVASVALQVLSGTHTGAVAFDWFAIS
jgi:hypothetical protein